MTRPVRRPVTSHKAVVALARRQPLLWTPVRRYRTGAAARAVVSQIENGRERHKAYGPAGSFEARAVDVDDETEVSVRPLSPDRPWTPDEKTETGGVRLHLKRCCNGCGQVLGDVVDRDMDAAGELTDVRGECQHCAPVVEAEAAGCVTWQFAPTSYARVVAGMGRLAGVSVKPFWRPADGRLCLRVGSGGNQAEATFGDWIIRYPDGHFTVHAAPTGGEQA